MHIILKAEKKMIKTILAMSLSAMVASTAMAAGKIVVLNTASNNGNMFTQAQAYAKDLEQAGYEVEFISPGNACKASAILSKIPAGQSVFSNIDAYGQAEPAAGVIPGCEALSTTPENTVAAYLDHFHMCTLSQKDNPMAIFTKGSSFKVGTNKPAVMWQGYVDQLNAENGTSHNRIQYGGSGKTRAALLAGEVDYVFLPTKHAFTLESKGAVCFAEFTDQKAIKSDYLVKDLSAGNGDFAVHIAVGWVMYNSTPAQVEEMRTNVEKFTKDPNSNIIAERGMFPPINYYGWEKTYAERSDWVNSSIKVWADTIEAKK